MTLRAGDLRHQIVIDEPVVTRTPDGGEVVVPRPFLRCWASIEPIRGKEAAQLEALSSTTSTRIRMRWTPQIERIDPKWQVRHRVLGRDTVYNIESITDVDRRHEEVEMLCSSGVVGG